MLKVKELNLPEEPGMAPQINWGEDFNNFDDIKKIIYLKKLCSALNHSADLIQKERNQLLVDIKVTKNVAENAEEAVAIQKAIVLKAITDHNMEKQEFANQLQTLERNIKEKDKIIEDLKFLRDE
jgi:hypothetical protein